VQIVEVSSADDPRLADYLRLTDTSLRTSMEAANGLFVAEGTKVIVRAVAAGYQMRSLLLGESRRGDLPALRSGVDPGVTAPVYVVPDEVAEKVTGFRVHRGALAAMERKELPSVAGVLHPAKRIVVLEDLVDHGNVGSIFRCAAALGVDAVVLSPRCADPLYRRSVKVSMGAVFSIPYARMTEWYDGLKGLRDAGFRVLALTPDEKAAPIGEALARVSDNSNENVALLLGTEGDGLSSRWLHEADEAVRIPMNPRARAAGVDSLNVVAAAAIACHLLTGSALSGLDDDAGQAGQRGVEFGGVDGDGVGAGGGVAGLVVRADPAAALFGGGAPPAGAPGIPDAWRGGADGFHHDVVPPLIAEVVQVPDLGLHLARDLRERDPRLVFAPGDVILGRVAERPARRLELVMMAVVPAEHRLERLVHQVEPHVGGEFQPSPHRRLGPAQAHLDLVDRGGRALGQRREFRP
jgi:tRNA G18 (ribose-2'-O)-methylase SpoU